MRLGLLLADLRCAGYPQHPGLVPLLVLNAAQQRVLLVGCSCPSHWGCRAGGASSASPRRAFAGRAETATAPSAVLSWTECWGAGGPDAASRELLADLAVQAGGPVCTAIAAE